MKALVLVMLLLLAPTVYAANVAVGSFGYHPAQYKQVVVYTAEESGTFGIYSGGTQVYSGTLAKPKDDSGSAVQCQGGQPCLVGDFTQFTQQGTYTIKAGADSSPSFTISNTVFRDRAPLFLEVFEALKQQGSSYHKDLHSQEAPAFLSMADGSFVMTTDQATVAGVRLASAYNRNPALFSFDHYTTSNAGAPDLAEHIKRHVQIVQGYQDAAGGTAVPYGYEFNFQCPMDYRPDEEKFTTSKNTCLLWRSSTSATSSVGALHLYAAAIPAIHQIDGAAAAGQLLERAKRTYMHIKGTYTLSDDNAAAFGAAAFMLYDYTGDAAYLRDAHSQRTKVNTAMDALNTKAREYYWEEYARHKAAIQAAGLQYDIGGKQPEAFFQQKIQNDWSGGLHPIARMGERIYVLDINSGFHHSRYMLAEALFAAKAREHGNDEKARIVADTHLAWLTGMNSIQEGDWAGPLASKSFIFGIGNHGKNQHIRLVQSDHYQNGHLYQNGKPFIPGWISGAKDSFNDKEDTVFNYYDDYWSWEYVETTDEIVAEAIELSAYLDAQYNGRAAIARPRLSSTPLPVCTPVAETCDQKDNDCDGQVDEGNVCAPACTPATETCNQKDDDCDGQVDENGVCAPVCTPSAEVCDQKDNDCDTVIDENNVCPPTTTPPTDTTCFSNVKDIPATCAGGSIIEEEYGGCHTVLCANDNNSTLKVSACDKDGYFEMYVQERTGSGLQVCIAGTCVGENGFAKSSSYPICIAAQTPPEQPPQEQPVQEQPAQRRGGGGGGGSSDYSVQLTDAPTKVTLFRYNAYSFDIGSDEYSLRAKTLGTEGATLSVLPGLAEIALDGEKNVDLDGDGTDDMHISGIVLSGNRVAFSIRTPVQESAPAETQDVAPDDVALDEVASEEIASDEDAMAAPEEVLPVAEFAESEETAIAPDAAASDAEMDTVPATMLPQSKGRGYTPYVIGALGLALVAVIAGSFIVRKPDVPVYDDVQPAQPAQDAQPIEAPPAEPEVPLNTEELREISGEKNS